MSQTPVISEGTRRRRPLQLSLAGVGLLILGLAFAFWLIQPFVHSWTGADSIVFILGGTARRMAELADWLAVAAVVLAVGRHLHRGGYPRPAEWLALALVLSRPEWTPRPLYDAFLSCLHALTVHPIEIGDFIYAPLPTTLSLFFAMVGCLGFAATRRVLPSRAGTPVVFVLALLMVWGALPAIPVEFVPLIRSIPLDGLGLPQDAAATGLLALVGIAFAMIWAVPAIATWRDYRRADQPAWSLGEWLGAAAALIAALGWVIGMLRVPAAWALQSLLKLAISAGSLDFLDLGAPAAAIGLACVVVRCYGTAWDHWLNGETHRAAPPYAPRRGAHRSQVIRREDTRSKNSFSGGMQTSRL